MARDVTSTFILSSMMKKTLCYLEPRTMCRYAWPIKFWLQRYWSRSQHNKCIEETLLSA